jgi:SHS2 domain-containing protein
LESFGVLKKIVIVKTMKDISGYQELEHTADWALKVWAPNLEILLVTAAKGMYALSNTETEKESLQTVENTLNYIDEESLLVDFLSELIFMGEMENLAVVSYNLKLSERSLSAKMQVSKIKSRKKEIKAVTFHELKITRNASGLETVVVFDV